jgi:periplasmic copper chaperone A
MKSVLQIAAIFLLCAGVIMDARAEIIVHDAWVRASLGISKTTAAYALISNTGKSDDELLSVSTTSAMMAQVHKSEEKDGIETMKPVSSLLIPAGATVELKPGGLHIMMMNLPRPLNNGETVELLFTFRNQGPVKADAKVVPLSEERQHHN